MARLRLLVTGSRHWPVPSLVRNDLHSWFILPEVTTLVVVHGACPTGADLFAQEFCDEYESWSPFFGKDLIPEPHPAHWHTYGSAAGPIRNQEMVDLGADIVLAYPAADSVGTVDCMTKAVAAGLTVINRAI